ncbi:MAG: Ig-like domain-containing protein [Candidatus Acidiferrales bacterium]
MAKSGFPLFFVVLSALALSQCSQPARLTSIQVIPDNPFVTTITNTVQFKALGTYQQNGSKFIVTKDLTTQVTWASSLLSVATINSSGFATTTGAGLTAITATLQAPLGTIVGTSTLDCEGLAAVRKLTSLRIIPGGRAVGYVGQFVQLMAIGMYNTEPRVQDITTQVHWDSSDARIATVDAAGLALGSDLGDATITASAKSQSGAIIGATTRLTQQAAPDNDSSRTLTVFDAGLGSGTIVSDPPGISCSPAGGCEARFPLGTTVALTAIPAAGSTFDNWSSNCLPNTAPTCSVGVRNNEPVGIIFH